ncbi:hypothetical protein PQX77_012214 [Marasmius sp. AFHP31]|nr:hypothetical protein PQX77_012214 [Marasmius sp. AFHP31]
MLSLSKNSGLCPTCLSIQNVKKIGKYPIAAGGFGDVWKGTIGESSELVCLKIVKVYMSSNLKKLTAKYQREAILWRQMKHPNVLPFYGIYQLEVEQIQQLCLISPWMEKGNLVEFLKATKREDIDHYALVFDVASGLAYLHSKKIVHSDLKGLNILITNEERACIADFGLSRITDSKGLRITTSTTRPVGTARWLAPELLIGSGAPSKESDIYAFACVCCEIFTGLQPFPEYANEITVIFHVAQGKRPSRPEGAPELSDAIWALMNMCWETTPSSRPTASHILKKVEEIASEAPTPLASGWSESLFKQVRENVEYRSISPSFPNGSQPGADRRFSNLLEAAPSPGMHLRTTLDPVSDSFPSSLVHTLATSSEVETRVDDNPGSLSNSGVKGVSSHPDHLKDIREVHPQIRSNGSLPTPLETDIEPPEVLSNSTQQDSSSYAKPTVSSPEDPNISVEEELPAAAGTVETASPYSLQVVIKNFWDSSLNRGRAQEQQDQYPAQQQAQRRREDLDDTSYNLVESCPDPDPPTATALALSRSLSYGSLIPGPPSPHQEPSGSNISKRKTPVHLEAGELTRLIGFITATSSEDWALVLDICERASASDSNANEAIWALRREFKYGPPQAQLSAARLWAIMLRNSTDAFICQSTGRKFLETLEELLLSSRTNPVVTKRVLDVLAAAAYASGSNVENSPPTKRLRSQHTVKPVKADPSDIYDDYLNSQVESQEWNERLHKSLGASMYATPRATPKAGMGQKYQSEPEPGTPSTSSSMKPKTSAAKGSIDSVPKLKAEQSPELELHLLSATEIVIFGLESDLKRAQRNFLELSKPHSDYVDKNSDEMSAMERQVLDAKIENKIIRTAQAADRKEWARREASLEAKLAEKTAEVKKLTRRIHDAEQDRNEALKKHLRHCMSQVMVP